LFFQTGWFDNQQSDSCAPLFIQSLNKAWATYP
jgi:hypothetical protein